MQAAPHLPQRWKSQYQSHVPEQSTSLPPLAAFIPPAVLDLQGYIYIVLHLNSSWDPELNSTTLHIVSSHSPKIHTHPQQYLPLASRPFVVPKGQTKLPGRKLPIFPVVCNDSVLSPLWADASSFIITFSKTMLMFVLCMKCLHNSLLKVLHSSYYT